jgi:hypothetical protein
MLVGWDSKLGDMGLASRRIKALRQPPGPVPGFPANALIQTLTTTCRIDRMPAFLDLADWATWLGEGGNGPIAAKAARKASQKRCRPTVSSSGGLISAIPRAFNSSKGQILKISCERTMPAQH